MGESSETCSISTFNKVHSARCSKTHHGFYIKHLILLVIAIFHQYNSNYIFRDASLKIWSRYKNFKSSLFI